MSKKEFKRNADDYLLRIGLDSAHLPNIWNDEDKSYYTIPELMESYLRQQIDFDLPELLEKYNEAMELIKNIYLINDGWEGEKDFKINKWIEKFLNKQ